jgi:hypothetical protein
MNVQFPCEIGHSISDNGSTPIYGTCVLKIDYNSSSGGGVDISFSQGLEPFPFYYHGYLDLIGFNFEDIPGAPKKFGTK